MAMPSPDELRRAMAGMPTGVTVLTASGPEGPAGATANAVTSLSLHPPLMLACFDRGSRTLAEARGAGRFGINVLRAEQADLARAFSTKAPHPEKWRQVAWREHAGVPILDQALIWVVCGLRDLLEGGDHVIAVGDVLDLGAAAGEPLVFHQGAYRALGAPG